MKENSLNHKAVEYLKQNKKEFITTYLKNAKTINPKIVIFTAGASGAGKTEYAITRKEKEPYLLHIDTDRVRDFFTPIGYNGNNSNLFQKASSKGVDILYKEAINKGYSIILDTNFSNPTIAEINLKKAIKHNYIIEIIYLLQDLNKCLEYAKEREKITKRYVPKEIIEKNFINSIKTVILVKEAFKDSIILNLIDRIENKFYENITAQEFFEKIPNSLKEIL